MTRRAINLLLDEMRRKVLAEDKGVQGARSGFKGGSRYVMAQLLCQHRPARLQQIFCSKVKNKCGRRLRRRGVLTRLLTGLGNSGSQRLGSYVSFRQLRTFRCIGFGPQGAQDRTQRDDH